MSTRTRFEKEARDNSEMAYWDTTRHLQKFQKEQKPGTQIGIQIYGYYFLGFACAFRIKFSDNEENMTYA